MYFEDWLRRICAHPPTSTRCRAVGPTVTMAVAVCLALAGGRSATAAEVVTFAKLDVKHPVSTLAVMEDGAQVLVAHREQSMVSVVDSLTGEVEKELSTPTPSFIIARGEYAFVANYGDGTISMYRRDKDWALEKKLPAGNPRPVRLTAPQGKAFSGVLIALGETQTRYEKDIMAVDAKSGRFRPFRRRGMMSAMTVDSAGRVLIWQGLPGSPSREIGGATDFQAELRGRAVRSAGRFGETMAILRQVGPRGFWFGGKTICAGLVPKPVRTVTGEFVIPDELRDGYYVLDRKNIECVGLDNNATRHGQRDVTYPNEYERMREGSPNINARDAEGMDYLHVAATVDKALVIYLFGKREKNVYWAKTDAFPLPSFPADKLAGNPRRPRPKPNKPATPTDPPASPDRKPGEFAELFPADDISSIELMPDGRHLAIAHQTSDKVTIWDVTAGEQVKQLATSAPVAMLCRARWLFVASATEGTISVFDSSKSWQQVSQTNVGMPRIVFMSAPHAAGFQGQVLVTCEAEARNHRQLILADVFKRAAKKIGNPKQISIASVDYAGRYYLWQGGEGSPAREIGGYKSFPALVAGRDSAEGKRGWETMPYVRQVRPGVFWFGDNRIYKGLPPKAVGGKRGVMIVPDRGKNVCYVVDKRKLECVPLGGGFETAASRAISFPQTYERMRRRPPNIDGHHTARFDFHHVAVTHGSSLYLYLLAGRQSKVFALKTDAFDVDGPASTPTDVAGTPGTPPGPSPGKPSPGKPAGPADYHDLNEEMFYLGYGGQAKSLLLLNGHVLRVLDATGKRVIAQHELTEPYLQIAERPKYYVALGVDRLDLLFKQNLKVARSFPLNKQATGLAVVPGSRTSYVTVEVTRTRTENKTNPVLQVDESTGNVVELRSIVGNMIAAGPAGRRIYVGNHVIFEDGFQRVGGRTMNKYGHRDSLTAYDVTGPAPRKVGSNSQPGVNGSRLVLAPDGAHAGYVSGGGAPGRMPYSIASFAVAKLTAEATRYQIEAYPKALAYHPSAPLVAAGNGKKVWIFHRDSGQPLADRWEDRSFKELRDLVFTPDGRGLLVAHEHANRGHTIEYVALRLTAADRQAIAKGMTTYQPAAVTAAPDPASPAETAKPRTWRAATGNFQVQATLVKVSGDTITLKRTDGRTITVPLSRLSQADRDFVKARSAAPSSAQPGGYFTGVVPSGWVKFKPAGVGIELAAPGELVKDDTSPRPYYRFQKGRGPMFEVTIGELYDPSDSLDKVLSSDARFAVAENNGKILRQDKVAGLGAGAMRLTYRYTLDGDEYINHQCKVMLGRTLLRLDVSAKADRFTPAHAQAADLFFKSLRQP